MIEHIGAAGFYNAEAQKAVEETEEATKEADRAIGEATFQSDLVLLHFMDLLYIRTCDDTLVA